MLQPGIYRFAEDTVNPCGDKRVSREFARLPMWKKGFRVVVRADIDDSGMLDVYALGGYSFHGFRLYKDKLRAARSDDSKLEAARKALLAALVREQDSIDVVNHVEDHSYEDMIDALLQTGRIALEDIRGALASARTEQKE